MLTFEYNSVLHETCENNTYHRNTFVNLDKSVVTKVKQFTRPDSTMFY
jgi:hypothetical protein